ncbi:FAM50 family protein [Golovinomyces cichoracearum]|uniref:FAM50 family protein n=1 Tax=Golovinomyces cichoracearum TaxID=62708 RepID=A0A420IM92_9PEZI|nr:FAM50 family protein [Golovinomyces cichoracearum]
MTQSSSGTTTPNHNPSTPQHRFTSQTETAEDILSKQTQGLVALSDFRKKRAQVIEAKERDAQASLRLALNAGGNGTGRLGSTDTGADTHRSQSTENIDKRKKKKRKIETPTLSFNIDEEEEDGVNGSQIEKKSFVISDDVQDRKNDRNIKSESLHHDSVKAHESKIKTKISVNSNLSVTPRALTKVALQREEQTRENLQKEFLLLQERIKSTEIEIPFVFYDGTNIPGGTCRVKKGDYIWVFLDRSRKAGAELKIGERVNSKRQWARIGVDDLMLVRGDLIIPHHYDFYYFIINRIHGPDNRILFNFSSDFSSFASTIPKSSDLDHYEPLSRPLNKSNVKGKNQSEPFLEGRGDDQTLTKVVDRRWYERNKHIFPASVWQEFDPKKDYKKEVKRDLGGNAFFFA